MRTLAIGDVHACNTALASLLNTVQPTPEDEIIFLGDYIDTGPAVGGWLTCLDVSSGKYWHANEKGSVRQGAL